ncbi:MFS transporter [Amycolatopsis rhabdoformis]|uniref:MFS transporter n=1 Tax=Amycolatopsis rhabdoformis TaxID=1448059 RepID=A0ABZ1IEU8_9PSEU|nr:MFS transporter [Amycolatopsis rhabdoformis]WSE32447.1 MFS transporter [Amycolatopsis rhabdoformis]
MSQLAPPARTARQMRKNILVSVAGSAIEWYDFFIYASASALVLNKLFFPSVDSVAGTLLAFSTFAVGFLIRPVGAAVFGHFGDKFGRKPTLVTAMMIMGAATTAIGLLPPYATLGVAAPILLVVLRLIQGLALGGQWGGAVLLVTESAPEGKRGFYGSFAQLGVPIALIFSNVMFLVLSAAVSPAAFLDWGWRIPFLLSIVLIGVGLYAQSRAEETHAAPENQTRRRAPLFELLRSHPKQILLAAGATVINGGAYYLLTVYILSYATQALSVPRGTILVAVLVSAVASGLTIPAAAALSDRIGRRRVFLTGAVLLAVWGFPMFLLVNTGSPVLITLALVVAQVVFSLTYGPCPALFSEMFGAGVRYSGVSVGYQIGAVAGGALAPIIATSLFAEFHTANAIALYLALMAAVSFVSVFLVTESVRRKKPVARPEATVATVD